MQRRKFVIGLGSLAAGGAAAMGSGAFTSATAERTVSVEVAGDTSAWIELHPESDYAEINDDDVLELDFTQHPQAEEWGYDNGAEGINPHSTYEFESVFAIGTKVGGENHDYQYYIEPSGFDVDVTLTAGGSAQGNTAPAEGTDLTEQWGFGGNPGYLYVDMTLESDGEAEPSAGGTLTIHAVEPDESG